MADRTAQRLERHDEVINAYRRALELDELEHDVVDSPPQALVVAALLGLSELGNIPADRALRDLELFPQALTGAEAAQQ